MPQLTIPVNENDHILGSPTSPVTLVEYGDYQCPQCKMTHSIIKQFRQELGEKLCVVFRHFPLKNAHPYAQLAAEIAEAASYQKKFWDMHNLLMKQSLLTPEIGLQLAEQLQLDIEQFKNDLQSPDIQKKIEEDFSKGIRSGVNGIPCFYINGIRYDGDPSYDSFKQALIQASSP